MKKKNVYASTLCRIALLSFSLVHTGNPADAKETQASSSPLTTALDDASAIKSQRADRAFPQMGVTRPVRLNGVEPKLNLYTGIRLDEFVSKAVLRLNFAYSPSLIFELSHLKVFINDELAATVPLAKEMAGKRHSRDIELDPQFLTGFAAIRLELVAHYTENCEDPFHSSLWAEISPESQLLLTTQAVPLVNDLALLPAPFFDRRDSRRLELPFWLPNLGSTGMEAAGLVASWLGAQAAYREARITAVTSTLPPQHSIVFGTRQAPPPGVVAESIQGPELRIQPDPQRSWIKRLYVLGRDEQELLTAAQGLVLEQHVLTGAKASITEVNLGPKRQAYDAPVFVRTDRPVRLGELVNDPGQLEVFGHTPNPIAINLKVPADLFSWSGKNVPLRLKYRYTPPSTWNDSTLNVEVNQALVQSFRLEPRDGESDKSLLGLGLLSDAFRFADQTLAIPAFRLGGNNQLTFNFRMASQKSGACNGTYIDATRAGIDPESTLDLSNLPHYTLMPNLAAFANGGYPFSNFADMAETAIVLPSQRSTAVTTAFLTTMAHLGKWTGLPALRVKVATPEERETVKNRHWLVLGTTEQTAWLKNDQQHLPMILERARRSLNTSEPLRWLSRWWREDLPFAPSPVGKALITTDGAIAAMVGFRSPMQSDRSVVMLTGSDETRLLDTVFSLDSPARVSKIRGSVTLMRGEQIEGFDVGNHYVMGTLPMWLRLRVWLSDYPWIVALLALIATFGAVLLSYGWLSRRAERRLQQSISPD